jgi:UDP-N-acetylmuramoyl-L-alanyl-D-glutamate--2,6-diaminopimelate ligase
MEACAIVSNRFATLEPISLRAVLPAADFLGCQDIRAAACASDSRAVQHGDVFFAISGSECDGHNHIREAVERGAKAVICQTRLEDPIPQCVVPDSREALALACQALAGHPSRKLRVIGITGTNGKTTTSHLLAAVLQAAGYRTGLLGTLGYSDGALTAAAEMTTPTAPAMAHWLKRMVDGNCSHAVVEISSHAIAQHRTAGVELAACCLTNLRRDHLDYHPSLYDYHHTKCRLFGQLNSSGVAVINADDPASLEHAPLVPGGVLSVALHNNANITAQLLDRVKSEQNFLLSAGGMSAVVRTAMIGDHHIYNCLMAAAMALAEGIDLMTIVAGLESVERVSGRLERIECGQPFGVFVDYAHTPDALAASLATLRPVTAGRLICVFGAGGNRDVNKRPLMGRAVEAAADVAIVTTDNPRHEDPQTIAAEIISGFGEPERARYLPDRAAAIHYALSLAGPDDVVLVAGRGHETYQTVGHQRVRFDDRDVARRYLYNLEPESRYGALAGVSNS